MVLALRLGQVARLVIEEGGGFPFGIVRLERNRVPGASGVLCLGYYIV